MIRISPLENRASYGAILELYFYMVAMVTPFSPEDVYPTGTFHEEGDLQKPVYPVKDFYEVTGKKARYRTPSYVKLLSRYGITDADDSPPEHRKNDALLAKRIINTAFKGKKNKSLYHFLYKNCRGKDNFHVNRARLHCLLTSYMDEESLKQAGLRFDHLDAETCKATATTAPRKILKQRQAHKDLDEVFRYAKFAKQEAVRLMSLLGVTVCPYCNRNFITTVSSVEGGTRQGQFDHYRNKSNEPWFALSLRNLVPSCGYCNHKKGDKTELVLYPYREGMDKHYRFRTRPVHGIGYLIGAPQTLDEFEIVGEFSGKDELAERIQNSLSFFYLEKLYQTHQEYIAWIFRQRYIFSDAYLKQLCRGFPTLFSSAEEARDMLYMRHISPDRWGEYPLSKLTHDIDEEITELEGYFPARK